MMRLNTMRILAGAPLVLRAAEASALGAVAPLVQDFGPTWSLMSCGFDSHEGDPAYDTAV